MLIVDENFHQLKVGKKKKWLGDENYNQQKLTQAKIKSDKVFSFNIFIIQKKLASKVMQKDKILSDIKKLL